MGLNVFGSTNVFGQAYFLMVFTPIKPGQEEPLRAFLEGMASTDSPLSRSPRTHFARWVIVPDMPHIAADPGPDHLDLQYLLFTSNFDGDLDSYLDDLCRQLAPEAPEIWGRCVGCPEPPTGDALKAYLKHNQIETGVAFAAYGDATVTDVKRAVDKRDRLRDFVVRAQEMEPAALKQAFLEEFGHR